MALSTLDRMRIVMDLLQDGVVANEGAYANCDKIGAVEAIPWVDPMIWQYQPSYRDQIDTLTNTQKAALLLNSFRKAMRDARCAMDASQAADSASSAAISAANSAAQTTFGDDDRIV